MVASVFNKRFSDEHNMANPKQRHTKGRRDRARKQYLTKPAVLQACPKCSTPKPPHITCPNCGTYKGREVKDTLVKVDKKAKSKKKK